MTRHCSLSGSHPLSRSSMAPFLEADTINESALASADNDRMQAASKHSSERPLAGRNGWTDASNVDASQADTRYSVRRGRYWLVAGSQRLRKRPGSRESKLRAAKRTAVRATGDGRHGRTRTAGAIEEYPSAKYRPHAADGTVVSAGSVHRLIFAGRDHA